MQPEDIQELRVYTNGKKERWVIRTEPYVEWIYHRPKDGVYGELRHCSLKAFARWARAVLVEGEAEIRRCLYQIPCDSWPLSAGALEETLNTSGVMEGSSHAHHGF